MAVNNKKTLVSSFKEMPDKDRRKLVNTVIMVFSIVVLVAGVALVFFSCKTDPSAYRNYSMPVDWDSVLRNSTWVVESGSLNGVDLTKIVFLDSQNGIWSCRMETDSQQFDECFLTLSGDRGSLVYGQMTVNIHLVENDGIYFMRLTFPDNSISDLKLVK